MSKSLLQFGSEWLAKVFGATEFTSGVATLTKTRYQEKTLSSNTTTNGGVLSELTFNNLTIGSRYKLTTKWVAKTGDAGEYNLVVTHNSGTLDIVKCRGESGSAGAGGAYSSTVIFTATGTTITFAPSGANAGRLGYGGTGQTKAILEELLNHEVTTIWN